MNSKVRKLVLSMGIGAAVGFVATYSLVRAANIGLFGDIDGSALAAMMVAMLYIAVALFVGIGTRNPNAGSRFLNVEDADELREQRRVFLLSSCALGLWGIALFALGLAGKGAMLSREMALIIAVPGLCAGSFAAWHSYQLSDELMVAMNREAGALSHMLTFVLLGGWAMLAHLEYLAGPATLDMLTAFYLLVLIATFLTAARRGILAPK